jgi:outer membrane protein TolC
MLLSLPTRSTLTRSAFALVALLLLTAGAARAQITFASAVSLALNNSPRVSMAHADVVKAQGALSETHDAYLPTVDGIMDLGYSYGAPIGEPTLFSFSAHSLVYNASQKDYTRAARFGLNAANLAYAEARQEVAEDAAVTYVSLSLAQQQSDALAQKLIYANRLVSIVQERLDAGQHRSSIRCFSSTTTSTITAPTWGCSSASPTALCPPSPRAFQRSPRPP